MKSLHLLIIGAILGGSGVARADDTFESKATGAEKITRLDDVVWALTASCDKSDDTQARQCRHVRDVRLAQLTSKPLVIEVPDAFTVSEWSDARRSADAVLSGCIKCDGIKLDGKTWHVVATAPRFDNGAVGAKPLSSKARPFDTDAARGTFAALAKTSRVQLVVKVADKPRWEVSGKSGVTLDVVAYRVYSPCDGSIILASPTSGPVAADPKACAKP